MKKILAFLKKVYRLSLNYNKQEELVWKELKKLHSEADWNFGVYEKEKSVETTFEISEEVYGTYYYTIYDRSFHCKVKIIENVPLESATDSFILAEHFNNLLRNGVVIVNVNKQYVEYHSKSDILIHLLYPGEIHSQLLRHYNVSKDIFWAFQKLIKENEAPAFIIADLLKMNDEEQEDK